MSITSKIISNSISGRLTGSSISGNLYGTGVSGRFIDAPTIIVNPYGPEATALFARMVVQPTTALKELIDKTISDLKTAGIWQITDKLHKWDLHTEQASLLDWKNDAHDATNVDGVDVFIPKNGLYTDGTSYVDLNYIPTIDSIYGSLENLALSLDDLTGIPTLSFNFGAYGTDARRGTLVRTNVDIYKRIWALINTTSTWKTWNSIVAAGNLYIVDRPNLTTLYIYLQDGRWTYGNSLALGLPDNKLIIGGYSNANASVARYPINTSVLWMGASLTEEQRTAWYDIINYWKTNIPSTF